MPNGDCEAPNGDGRLPNGEGGRLVPWGAPPNGDGDGRLPNGEEEGAPEELPNGDGEGVPDEAPNGDELGAGVDTPQISSFPMPGGVVGDWLRASRLAEALGSALKPILIPS